MELGVCAGEEGFLVFFAAEGQEGAGAVGTGEEGARGGGFQGCVVG